MPPKEGLTKENIIDGAYELLRAEGYDAINARTLATRLGCSTMPLFRHFSGMGEIRQAAVDRAIACYNGYIQQGLTDTIPFKGVGRAYIRFAKEEPQLFKLFFLTPNACVSELPTVDPNFGEVARAAADSSGLERESAEKLFFHMWIFVHGLATLIASGKKQFSEKEIGTVLSETFAGLRDSLQKKEETNQ